MTKRKIILIIFFVFGVVVFFSLKEAFFKPKETMESLKKSEASVLSVKDFQAKYSKGDYVTKSGSVRGYLVFREKGVCEPCQGDSESCECGTPTKIVLSDTSQAVTPQEVSLTSPFLFVSVWDKDLAEKIEKVPLFSKADFFISAHLSFDEHARGSYATYTLLGIESEKSE